jgi:hypothetical protein
MRRFVRFSERAAQGEGITPQQYLLLLHVKGLPGRAWALVGELAERLQRLAALHRAELKSLAGVFEVPQIDYPSRP